MTNTEQNTTENLESHDQNLNENPDSAEPVEPKKRVSKKKNDRSTQSDKLQKLLELKEKKKQELHNLDKLILEEIELEKSKNKDAIIKLIEKNNLLDIPFEMWQKNIEEITELFIK